MRERVQARKIEKDVAYTCIERESGGMGGEGGIRAAKNASILIRLAPCQDGRAREGGEAGVVTGAVVRHPKTLGVLP